jgi:solute carrier family 25 protein 33/36
MGTLRGTHPVPPSAAHKLTIHLPFQRLKKLSTQTYPGEPTKSRLAEWLGIVGSSGGSKMVASLITYPHEVLRTRLRQPTEPGARGPKYTGLVQTLKLVIKEEG